MMRRKERLVTDELQIKDLLEECQVCRLGLSDQEGPYIVPLNYGYIYENGRLILYFHSAGAGRKLNLIGSCPKAGFEIDGRHSLVVGTLACQYSYHYASVIGRGNVEIVMDKEEKQKALGCMMKHLTGRTFDEFDKNEKLEHAVTIIKLTAAELTCKMHV